jgi:hydrogenase maturation factor
MPTFTAINRIERRVKGQTVITNPGDTIVLSGEEADEMVALGAVREGSDDLSDETADDQVPAKTAKQKKAKTAKQKKAEAAAAEKSAADEAAAAEKAAADEAAAGTDSGDLL